MSKRVLICNRGEISARILRTLRKMNITSIAVYSDADKNSPYTSLADEAYYIGPSNPAKSYLNMENIIRTAKFAKADAIHPGYGFLSENEKFAKMVEDKGFIWIGPNPDVMTKLSSKIECRRIAKKASVPITPGTGILKKNSVESDISNIGFPLLLKPDRGGGGKGIKRIFSSGEVMNAFQSATSESLYAFGNSDLYAEKYVEDARHVEIQIVADRSGNVFSLGERDCSVQRRYQKIIEEAPSPKVSQGLREKMYEVAKNFITASGYDAVGTLEFIIDKAGNPYFMEINERIQVEHPVTEETTGLDIVRLQIENGFDGKVSISKDYYPQGHAIEARVYAEDPETFFPSPGQITLLQIPKIRNIRIDHSLANMIRISPFYDPLLAKVISRGKSRSEALNSLLDYFPSLRIEGIKTNIPLIERLLSSEEYRSGDIDTSFMDKK